MRAWLVLLASSLAVCRGGPSGSVFSIDDFGAVPTENSLEAALSNGAALTAALEAAHAAGRGTVILPANVTYYSLPFSGNGHVGVNLVVDGTLKACNLRACQDSWSNDSKHFDYFFQWNNGTDLTLEGEGVIDGQGWIWWSQFLVGRLPGDMKRPGLVYLTEGTGLTVANITLKNSPIM